MSWVAGDHLVCVECGREPRDGENADDEWRAYSDGAGELHTDRKSSGPRLSWPTAAVSFAGAPVFHPAPAERESSIRGRFTMVASPTVERAGCGKTRMEIRAAPDVHAGATCQSAACNEGNETRSVIAMIRNMGTFDRGFRVFVVAPVAIVVAFLLGAGTLGGIVLFVFAGLMLATAVTAFCPTYTVIGISTLHGPHRVGHGLRAGHA